MNSLVRKLLIIASASSLSTGTSAFEVQHDAHEHGHATLSIVQENNELQLFFVSPAADIVGFEHMPESAGQRAKVKDAKAVLSSADKLFVLTADAGCTIEHAKVKSALLAYIDDHDKHHDEHNYDDHHDEHEHDKHHDEHKHADHDHHDHDKESHSEFEVEYHYECDRISALSRLKVMLFERFPSLEEIEAQIISDNGQRIERLDSKNTEIEL